MVDANPNLCIQITKGGDGWYAVLLEVGQEAEGPITTGEGRFESAVGAMGEAIDWAILEDLLIGHNDTEISIHPMARDYFLHVGNARRRYSERPSNQSAPPKPQSTDEQSGGDKEGDGDFLPMHRKEGDSVQFPKASGGFWTGTVVKAKKHLALIMVKRGFGFAPHFFLEDAVEGFIQELDDSARCTVCGEFLCVCNQPSVEHETENEDMAKTNATPIPLSELDEYEDGQIIECVEGVITSIYAAKQGTKGKFKWSYQGGYLTDDDQNEHRFTFEGVKLVAPHEGKNSVKGKRVRISAVRSGGELKYVFLKEEENTNDKSNPYRKIHVQEGAKIEWLDRKEGNEGVGNDGEEEPEGKPQSRGTSQRSSGGGSNGGGGSRPSHGQIPFRTRVRAHLSAMAIYNEVYEEFKAKGVKLPELTSEDIRSGTIAIIISSQRAEPLPFFGEKKEGNSQSTDGDAEGQVTNFDQAAEDTQKEKVKTWRDFVHQRSGKTLGEWEKEDEGKLFTWAEWAYSSELEEDDKEGRIFQANILQMCAEKNIRPGTIFTVKVSDHEGYNKTYSDNDLQAYLKESYGVSNFRDLKPENYVDMLRKFDDVIEWAEENHKKGTKNKKGGVPD